MSRGASLRASAGFRILVPLLPGLYAWLSTVMFPAFRSGWPARAMALAALLLLVAGTVMGTRVERVGRALGVWGFLTACIATWLLAADQLAVERLDTVRAASGAIGWALFAFGWGNVRAPGAVPEEDPRAIAGAPLERRGEMPPGAAGVAAVGVLGALAVVLSAWRVRREDHALFAHAVAFVAAVALVSAAAHIAVERGKGVVAPSGRSLAAASLPLTLAIMLLVIGMMWLVLR